MSTRAALAALVLALAGCGGDDAGTGASAAGVAPAAAEVYVELDTDLSSDQWERVQGLLDRFPSRPQAKELLQAHVLGDLELDYERDVAPALGPTLAVVVLDAKEHDAVVLTQPEDDAKFDALVARVAEQSKEEVVTGDIGEWRAAAERRETLDALRNASGGVLADDADFKLALDEAPDDRAAFAFMRGRAADELGRDLGRRLALDWGSGWVEAREEGAAFAFVTHGGELAPAKPYASKRLATAPGDALAFFSFDGAALREGSSALAPLAQMFGFDLSALLAGVEGEGALWVRPGAGLPEVTLVVDTREPERVRAALERLLRIAPFPLRVGVVEGEVVATTASSPEAALRLSGPPLGETDGFKEAAEVAGMPDETSGLLYLDVADALPLLGLAVGVGAPIPPELVENLRPIRSVLAWSEGDGEQSAQTLFVHIQ